MQTIEPEMMSPERGDARAAILKAARALVERDGVENLTLGKVAAEASLPRPVVYGQFVRKEDLLLCVAADSLATLARQMGGIEDVPVQSSDTEDHDSAVILTLPRSEVASDVADMMIETGREISAAIEGSTEISAASPVPERRQSRRIDMTNMMERRGRATPRDDVAVVDEKPDDASTDDAPTEKTAPRAPDAWLERRLRVFERAMTAMEARQEQVEKDSRTLVVSAENSIKALEETLSGLVARLDECEARQKAAADELRMSLSEAQLRIQTVEGVARAALVENDGASFEMAPAEPERSETVFEVHSVEPHIEAKAQAGEDTDALHKSFLDTARASAIAAAAVKTETEAVTKKPKKVDMRIRYVLIGFLVGAVFVAAASVAFSKGVHDGRNEALRRTAMLVTQPATVQASVTTPLDKLTRLAESGNAAAELEIANRYLDGTGTIRNAAAGFRWMTRAAKQGNAVAQFLLGSLYQTGIGTSADPVRAMHWYEAAALQGNRKAMHDLGVAYAQGLGGVTSPTEAARWFSRAASLGYVDSQFDLAVLYERGDGVPQSLLDAYKWYAIASAQGDAESKSRIEALRTQLSQDDLAAAQHAANIFRAAQFDQAANISPKI